MIIAEQKTLEELKGLIGKSEKVLVVGCGITSKQLAQCLRMLRKLAQQISARDRFATLAGLADGGSDFVPGRVRLGGIQLIVR